RQLPLYTRNPRDFESLESMLEVRAVLSRRPGSGRASGLLALLVLAEDLAPQPHQRVVAVARHALLHRDDPVVGDVDVLGAHLRAALGDVAVAEALLVLRRLAA